MAITTEQIKELRDKTGISVMQCKKALEEAGGDMGKALVIIQKNSKSAAAKKADRTLGAGAVQAYIHSTGTVGAMVELLCETDFVARNDEFKTLAREIALQVAGTDPKFVSMADISETEKSKAAEVFAGEVEGKPEDMKAKIIDGKLSSFFKDKVLLEQEYVKNPEITINGLIESAIQKFGEKIEVGHFSRFSI